jgi:phosphoglucosamine mutase
MTPGVLKDMGMKVIPINCNPHPRFSRPSEPLPENLPYLGEYIRKSGARCAIAHDGDADRMIAWDSQGRPISGDHLMMLFTSYLGVTQVVTTMDASMAIETIAEVRRTSVGDAFVSEQLREWGVFGAEPSGTWIFPEISYCPDGIYAAALFCEMVTEWDIEGEIEKMPRFQMLRESIATPYHREILQVLGATSPTDGIRITEEQGWILIRASGTEPKIRITVEGDSVAVAKELLRKGCAMVMKAKKNPAGKGHKGA